VLVTTGQRDTLVDAVVSAASQVVDADVSTTLWLDARDGTGATIALPPTDRQFRVVDTGVLPTHPWKRLATLRQMYVEHAQADYVAFLDDDNVWEPDHLASLLELARQGYPAVHSWRRLIDVSGAPVTVDRFPWLPPGEEADARYAELADLGVIDPASDVIQDRVDDKLTMVDIGEWLFDVRLLGILRFSRPRTDAELAARIGEDDVILEQLVRMGTPIACTRRPTLWYRLGGMSTPEFAEGRALMS
jgi:hypothetical protein